jgi:hypothetical protein
MPFPKEDPFIEIFRTYPIIQRNVWTLRPHLTVLLSVKKMEGRDFLINREGILQQQQTLDWLQGDWVEMRTRRCTNV